MLSEITKSRIRVHMGVPVLGVQNSGFAQGYRYMQEAGLLEYRMNNLQPVEEAQLTGWPIANIQITGTPQVGDRVSFQVNSLSTYVYTVQSSDLLSTDILGSIAANAATGINQTYFGNPVAAAYVPSLKTPYPTASTPWAAIILQGVSSASFFVTVGATGHTTPIVTVNGASVPPSYTFTDDGETINGYVAILDYLEGVIARPSDLAKFSKADVVNFRANEIGYRRAIYREWQGMLSRFLGIRLDAVSPSRRANVGLSI